MPKPKRVPVDELEKMYAQGMSVRAIIDRLKARHHNLSDLTDSMVWSAIYAGREKDPTKFPRRTKLRVNSSPPNILSTGYVRTVLQAISNEGRPVTFIETIVISGYSFGSCSRAIAHLCRLGLVERVSGHLLTTERGKIALALMVGRESRKRSIANVARRNAETVPQDVGRGCGGCPN